MRLAATVFMVVVLSAGCARLEHLQSGAAVDAEGAATPAMDLVAAALALSACTSPEATRMRAGGPGADVGNRHAVLKTHEGSVPFWQTPQVADIRGPPLEEARQADRLSR